MHLPRQTFLSALEREALWLSAWMIHHANHVRPYTDGLKVGGHQASSVLCTIMAALYGAVLRPLDRVAVKPHAAPVLHALLYIFGRQSRENLENFRGWKDAQSYPSRTKDGDDVDFSTGSVGLELDTCSAMVKAWQMRALGCAMRQEARYICVFQPVRSSSRGER